MRFMAAKNVNEGRKAAAFNVLLILPISAIVVSNAGWIGRAIANGMPGISLQAYSQMTYLLQ